jgi:hypothetical protein
MPGSETLNRIFVRTSFSETEDRSRFRRYSRLLVYLLSVTNVRSLCRKMILSQLPESLFEPLRAPTELVHQVSDWGSGVAADFGWMREAKRRIPAVVFDR